ncbi:MAG: hypothetical protein ACK5MT_04005 [Actinomycetales bacterium]
MTISPGIEPPIKAALSAFGVRTAALTIAALLALPAAPALAAAPASSESSSASNARSADSMRTAPAEQVSLPDGLRPEGITAAPSGRLFVGSLADGRIVVADPQVASTSTLLPGEPGRQLRGLFHDARTGLVWAAGNLGSQGYVWAVDGSTGAVVAAIQVPGALFLNDLVVTRDAVWVTDSRVDRLTVIHLDSGGRPTDDAPDFVQLTGQWPAGDGNAINANGIRALPDGTAVLNNSRVGGLWNLDPRTGRVQAIAVIGGPGISGGDGLDLRGATLFNVRGSGAGEISVLRIRRGAHGWRAHWCGSLTDPRLDVPSTAVVTGNTLWAVNARFGTPDPATADYWVTPLQVRARR